MKTSRFPPSDAALAACTETVAQWQDELGVATAMQDATYQLACRVNSWIGPTSVQAGVRDVVTPYVTVSDVTASTATGTKVETAQAVARLGDLLSARLMNDGLLVASARKSVSFG